MKRLYGSTDMVEVEMISLALRDNEIPHLVEDAGGSMLSIAGAHGAIPIGIYVEDANLERAATVIREIIEMRKALPPEDQP